MKMQVKKTGVFFGENNDLKISALNAVENDRLLKCVIFFNVENQCVMISSPSLM